MRQKILDYLQNFDHPQSRAQIMNATGLKRTTTQSALADFLNRGLVEIAFFKKGGKDQLWQQVAYYQIKKEYTEPKVLGSKQSPFHYLINR